MSVGGGMESSATPRRVDVVVSRPVGISPISGVRVEPTVRPLCVGILVAYVRRQSLEVAWNQSL